MNVRITKHAQRQEEADPTPYKRPGPRTPASSGSTDRKALLKAVASLFDEERQQTDKAIEALREEMDSFVEELGTKLLHKADQSLSGFTGRMDRFAERIADIEAARQSGDERARELLSKFAERLDATDRKQAELDTVNAELAVTTRKLGDQALDRTMVPLMRKANLTNLVNLCHSLMNHRATEVERLHRKAAR